MRPGVCRGRWVEWRVERIVRKTAGGVGAFEGQTRHSDLGRSASGEVAVDLAGDVALEDTHDLGLGEPLAAAAGDVGAGARLGAHAGEHDPPTRRGSLGGSRPG